jgi:uncharacterized membrane protein YbhN (UPF0104 family)
MPEMTARLLGFLRKHPLVWRLGMVVVLFTILLSNIHPHDILTALRNARPLYLGIAIAMMVPSLVLQTAKWNFLLGTISPRPHLKYAVVSLIGGFFLGAVSPARTGELGRGFFIPGHSKVRIASLTVLDKGFNHVTTYTASFIALFLALPWPLNLIPVAAEAVLVTILVNLHRLRPSIERLLRRFSRQQTTENALALFDALSWRYVGGMILFSIAFFLTYTTQFYFIFLCFTDLNWFVAVKTIPLIYAINLIAPVTIGDLGVKEMASVKLLGPFGIAGGAAFSASLTQNIVTFIIPSIVGGFILALGNRKLSRKARPSDARNAPLTGK